MRTGSDKKLPGFKKRLHHADPDKCQLAKAIGLLVISGGIAISIAFTLIKIIDIIYNLDQFKSFAETRSKNTSKECN